MQVEDIRELIAELPAVTEEVKWEENLCFLVGGKIFIVASLAQPLRVAFKCAEEDFEPLTDRDGIMQAPHFARRAWVQVVQPGALSRGEWKHYLGASYTLVRAKLTKKVRAELGL